VKHHWGKGNQFCLNEGAGPLGAKGAGPNKGKLSKMAIINNMYLFKRD